MTIGERIKQKRIELNMSQDELAKKVGYKSRSSIQKIEAARDLPLRKVSIMASALETSPAYLMGWEEQDDVLFQAYADMEDTIEAERLYDLYKNSTPEIQSAVELLLKSAQQKP